MVIGIRVKISADELRTQLRKLAGMCRQAADEYRSQAEQVKKADEAAKDVFSQMAPAFRVVRHGPRPSDVLLADAAECESLAREYDFKAAHVDDGEHELPDFVLWMMGFFDQDKPAPTPAPDQPPAPSPDQQQPVGPQDQPQQPVPDPGATPVQSQAPTTP